MQWYMLTVCTIACITANVHLAFSSTERIDLILQIAVTTCAGTGFAFRCIFNRRQPVAHVLRQLISGHAPGRDVPHHRSVELLLHVFYCCLHRVRRDAVRENPSADAAALAVKASHRPLCDCRSSSGLLSKYSLSSCGCMLG